MSQFGSLIVNGASTFIGQTFAPTQAAGTNNDTVATTAFVTTALNAALQAINDDLVDEDNNENNEDEE